MILYIGNKLSRHGFTPTSIETLGNLLSEHYSIIYASDKKNQFLRLLDMVLKLLINRKRIKVILIDTYSFNAFYYAVILSQLGRALSKKYIPILRGGGLPGFIKNKKFISDLIFKNAYINVAPSPYLKEEFTALGYKVSYIPNNLRIDNYEFKLRSILNPKLLYVRSFHRGYNPQMAVLVFKRILDRFPEAKLSMVGPDKDGSLAEVKELVSQLNLNSAVSLPGKLTKEEWTTLSVEFDIFINPTNYDNTPVSVMEAMALGIPVVTTDAGGIPYLFTNMENVLMSPIKDPDKMYENIMTLLENPNVAKKLSSNGRYFVEQFDWGHIKHKWFSLLNEII